MTSQEIQARIEASRAKKDKYESAYGLKTLLKKLGKRSRPDLVAKIKARGHNP